MNQYCLETFHGTCPADLNLEEIYVILDGCPDEDMQADNQTFQALVTIMGLNVPAGGASVIHQGGCRVYLGEVGSLRARLYVKGRGDFQRSKRRSIMAFYDILCQRIASGNADEPLAVLHMDADTGSAEPRGDNSKTSFGLQNVARLLRIMRANENLGGLATQVRVLHRTKNVLALMQSFDCNMTYVGLNGGASLAGRSTACLGMTTMYRYRALHVSAVKGVLAPLSAFSRAADRSIVDHVNLDMNEDQGMTTFILRAGYDTKTSLVTRFYTFAPETLAELLGQRRRWQAGFFVGIPSQVLGSPSPHFQLSRLRWLVAGLTMIMYANMLLMPGTLGYLLAFMFDQAYVELIPRGQALFGGLSVGWAECNGRHLGETVEEGSGIPTALDDQGEMAGCSGGSGALETPWAGGFARQAVFASCVWLFWLAFIASTLGHAPKKIPVRCRFFFTTACVVTAAIVVAAALVSRVGRAFLGAMVVWNAAMGLFLTYDIREWLHRLQEVLPYCIYMCTMMPMITMHAVANIDSALWGTRSIGEVKNASTTTGGSAAGTDTDTDSVTDKVVRKNPSRDNRGDGDCAGGGGGGIMMRAFTLSTGQRKTQAAASDADEEEAVPLKGPNSDVVAVDDDDYGRAEETEQTETEARRCGKRGSGVEGRGNLSLRAWKFVILASWMLANVGLTASYLRWRLDTLAALGFFSQSVGLVFFIVAAWLEMRLQRSYAMSPSPWRG